MENTLPQLLFTHLHQCESGWSVGKRSHPECHEVTFILTGKGSFTIEEVAYPAEVGDVFLIQSGQSHCAAADISDPYVYYTVLYSFLEEQAFPDLFDPDDVPFLNVFFSGTYYSLSRVRLSEVSEVREIIGKMETERTSQHVGYQIMRRVYLLQLLAIVARVALQTLQQETTHPLVLQNHHLFLANRIKRYLEAHLTRRVTLEDVAKASYLSPRYCCSIFKEATGQSPTRFTVFLLKVKNYTYPKVKVDLRKVVIITSNGRRYSSLSLHEIEEYYRPYAVGYAGNAYEQYEKRKDILKKTLYVGDVVFSGQEASGYVVFPKLYKDVEQMTLWLNDVVLRFDFRDEPVETLDAKFFFRRDIERVHGTHSSSSGTDQKEPQRHKDTEKDRE